MTKKDLKSEAIRIAANAIHSADVAWHSWEINSVSWMEKTLAGQCEKKLTESRAVITAMAELFGVDYDDIFDAASEYLQDAK